MNVYLPVFPSACLPACLSVSLSVCPSIPTSVRLYVCMYDFPNNKQEILELKLFIIFC